MTLLFGNRKRSSYTQLLKSLVIPSALAAAVTSCIMIPYEPDSEVSLSDAGPLSSSEMMVTVGPRTLLAQVSDAIAAAETRVKIADPVVFRDAAFPDGDWRVARLFEKGNCIRAAKESDIQYLVLVGKMEEIILKEVGGIDMWIGFYGAGYAEGESRLSATIVDLFEEHPMHDVRSAAKGTTSGVGLFYGLFIVPRTDASAIKGLGREIAKTIIDSTEMETVNVAVLAIEPIHEEYASHLEKEKILEDLRKRASQGESDAQWELYREQPTAEHLVMLCRAADQGHPKARQEIGKLHFYGYRKFENTHITPDIPRACMWSHIAGQVQITGQSQSDDAQQMSVPYKSPEVERTAKVMTMHQLEEAENLVQAWESGQCDRDFARVLGAKYSNESDLAGLCMEADLGSFSARDVLGQTYFFGFHEIEVDLPRAYMWYQLAAKVYVPPGRRAEVTQSMCDAMTPEQRSIAVKYLEEWKPGKCEQELLQK